MLIPAVMSMVQLRLFVRQFSMNLRAELADKNIRITNIEPGLCGDTEFSNVRFKGDDQRAAEVYESVEFIQSQDIADTALWLYQRPARMNVNSIESCRLPRPLQA